MRRRPAGFTLLELLVAVAIIAVLVAILMPVLASARASARAAACLANTRSIATAFHTYAGQNRNHLPSEDAIESWDYLVADQLQNEGVLVCPADADVAAAGGVSYAWRDSFEVDDPRASLEGRKLDTIKRTDLVLTFEDRDDLHALGAINAALVDTSARTFRSAELTLDLARPVE